MKCNCTSCYPLPCSQSGRASLDCNLFFKKGNTRIVLGFIMAKSFTKSSVWHIVQKCAIRSLWFTTECYRIRSNHQCCHVAVKPVIYHLFRAESIRFSLTRSIGFLRIRTHSLLSNCSADLMPASRHIMIFFQTLI